MTQGKRQADLSSVKPLSFPKLDLFQMRGSVKPYEPVRKALLHVREKLISANLGGKGGAKTAKKVKYNRGGNY